MGRKSRIKQSRSLEKRCNLIWSRSESSFLSPAKALIALAKSDNSFRESLWTGWKAAALEQGSHRVIGLFFSNFPPAITGVESDFTLFVSEQDLENRHLNGVTQEHIRRVKRFFAFFEPLVFESHGLTPPLFAMWSDGFVDGDFVTEPCLVYPVGFGRNLIESGAKQLEYYK